MKPADHPLARVLVDLGADEDATATRLEEEELEDPRSAPAWLVDLLAAVRDGRTNGWVDFQRPETDDTNVVEFIRGLPDLIPATYENNEESWIMGFPERELEAGISWEGSCYKVSKPGQTWS